MKKTLMAALLLSAWLAPAASQLKREFRTDGKVVQAAFAEAAKAAAKADQLGNLKSRSGNLMLLGMAYFNGGELEPALQAFRRAKQDRDSYAAAAKWESYTLTEIERLRAIERTRIELRKRTEEALEAQENNLDAIGGGRS